MLRGIFKLVSNDALDNFSTPGCEILLSTKNFKLDLGGERLEMENY